MPKTKTQRQREAQWRQARKDLVDSYRKHGSDAAIQKELAMAKNSELSYYTAYRSESILNDRAQWIQTLLSAPWPWLNAALEGYELPRSLAVVLEPLLKARCQEHLEATLPSAKAPRPKPRM